MAETESGSSTGVVAIFAIMLLILIGGFIAWRVGVFGGGTTTHHHQIDINVNHS